MQDQNKTRYIIRSNYRIVLKFFKITWKTCGKICVYVLRIHFKKDLQRTHLMMFMRLFFLIFLKKTCKEDL